MKYVEIVKKNLNLEKEELYFKSDNNYRYMLEHVNKKLGDDYLLLIKNEFKDIYLKNKDLLITLCNLNDKYGKTLKNNFNDFCNCSPTNLRYIYQTLLILEFMKKQEIKDIDIIEVGGGYGGLCFFLFKLSKLYNINIKSYNMFDLDEVCEFQKKYLKIHDIDINTNNIEKDIKNINKDSFLISNYAFSEIDKYYQDLYTIKLFNKYIKNGFLAWNAINVYKFIENKEIYEETERPLTGKKNKYLYIK